MSETLIVACKIRNGLNVGGIVVRGYYQGIGEPIPENSYRGYALTMGFPRKVWDYWFKHNKDSEVVTNKFIMAADDMPAMRELLTIGVKRRVAGSIPYRAEPYRG